MLKLYGFPVSNYVNMVELALLEKGISYEYVMTFPDQSEAYLAKSPRGKVPCLETPEGFLNEASVILEYLEETGIGQALLPTEPYARGRVRALMKEIELYIELPARQCFPEAFFGASLPEGLRTRAKDELLAGIATLKRHAAFAPYVAGEHFTLADIVLVNSMENAVVVAKKVFGIDPLADFPAAAALLQQLGAMPNVVLLAQRRIEQLPAFVAAMQARFKVTR